LAADFTYVWTGEGWLFVAVILDLYSRRVVGWWMQATMTTQLVMDALLMAIFRRGRPCSVLHHSDQGSPTKRLDLMANSSSTRSIIVLDVSTSASLLTADASTSTIMPAFKSIR